MLTIINYYRTSSKLLVSLKNLRQNYTKILEVGTTTEIFSIAYISEKSLKLITSKIEFINSTIKYKS